MKNRWTFCSKLSILYFKASWSFVLFVVKRVQSPGGGGGMRPPLEPGETASDAAMVTADQSQP